MKKVNNQKSDRLTLTTAILGLAGSLVILINAVVYYFVRESVSPGANLVSFIFLIFMLFEVVGICFSIVTFTLSYKRKAKLAGQILVLLGFSSGIVWSLDPVFLLFIVSPVLLLVGGILMLVSRMVES